MVKTKETEVKEWQLKIPNLVSMADASHMSLEDEFLSTFDPNKVSDLILIVMKNAHFLVVQLPRME